MASGIKVRELFTLWGFDIDTKPLKEVDGLIAKTKSGLSMAKWAIGGTIAAALGAAKFTANAGDEAVKTAQKVGLTVEAYQELAYAAKLADVETGTLKSSMRILGTNSRSAWQGGKEASAAFAALGVSVKGADGRLKPASALLAEVADRFAAMTDAQREMAPALAAGIFGRGGAEMLPLLYGGSKGLRSMAEEARKLGGVLSTNDAVMGEAFNDDLERMWTTIKGIRNEIGVQLLPVLGPLIQQFTEWFAVNRQLLGQNITGFVELFGGVLRQAVPLMNIVASVLGFILPIVNRLVSMLTPFLDLLGGVFSLIADVFSGLFGGLSLGGAPVLAGATAMGFDYMARGNSSVAGGLFGAGAVQAIPVPGLAGAGRSVTNVTELKPQINVTVPASTNPTMTGAAVGQAASYEMQKLLRQAMLDLKAQEAY